MTEFMSLRLLSLLSNDVEDSDFVIELKSAYEELAKTLLDKLQQETDFTKLYYNLGFVRLELAGICEELPDGKGKKCP